MGKGPRSVWPCSVGEGGAALGTVRTPTVGVAEQKRRDGGGDGAARAGPAGALLQRCAMIRNDPEQGTWYPS